MSRIFESEPSDLFRGAGHNIPWISSRAAKSEQAQRATCLLGDYIMYARKLIPGVAAAALLATPVTVSLPTDGWSQVSTIVVTTRKREENIQDIPIAVTAFGLQDIDRKSIDSITDLSRLSSSLQWDQSATPESSRIVIRGLSPTRGRQNVAILVDGVDISSESIAQTGGSSFLTSRLADLQRVEVAKGPQSALYGRSAFNGAIQFITQDPAEEFEAEMQVEGGNFDRYEAQASVSGPLTDTLGFRVSGSWWDEEGFYKNARNGQKVGGQDGFNVAGTLRWEATDSIWFRFRGEYQQSNSEQSASLVVNPNFVTTAPAGACVDQIADGPASATNEEPDSVFGCDSVRIDSLSAAEATAYDAALNGGVAPVAGPVTATNTLIAGYAASAATQGLFGQYLGAIPDMSALGPPNLSPDPRTGQNFPGLEVEHVRLNLQAGWDVGIGSINYWGGYFEGDSHSIVDWQSAGDLGFCGTFVDPVATATAGVIVPATIDPTSVACVLAYNDNRHELTQISQEVRFASDWDSWVQITGGVQYWDTDRKFFNNGGTVRARSFDCANPPGTPFNGSGPAAVPYPCDVYSVPITGPIFQDALDAGQAAFGGLLTGVVGQREVKHWSFYGSTDIDIDGMFAGLFDGGFLGGGWSLILEGRYNRETENVNGLDSTDTGSTGVNICGGGPIFSAIQGVPIEARAGNGCAGIPVSFGATTGGPPLLPVTTANLDTPFCGAFTADELDPATAPWFTATPVGDPARFAELFALTQNCDGVFENRKFGENKSDWFTGKFTLQWQPTEDVLLYFSHAWAQKPAGFSTVAFGSAGFQPTSDRFDAEKMRVYEAGFKSTWMGGQLVVNGAGFFQNYADKQVNTQRVIFNPFVPGDISTSPLVINASSAEVWGGEIDLFYAPDWEVFGGNITLGGSYTFLDAKYTDFVTQNFSGTDIYVVNNCTPELFADNGIDGVAGTVDDIAIPTCLIDRSGFTLEDAPRNAATMSATYVRPLGNICGCDVDMFWEADGQYTGKRFVEDTESVFVDSYWNSNMRIGVQTEQYEFLFFVNNIFQGDGIQNAHTIPGLACCFNFFHGRRGPSPTAAARGGPVFNSATVVATLRPPRHWGFRATARF